MRDNDKYLFDWLVNIGSLSEKEREEITKWYMVGNILQVENRRMKLSLGIGAQEELKKIINE